MGESKNHVHMLCDRALSIAQGELLPKCELVDTTFHALSTNGPGTATQSALPTSWGKAERQKQTAWRKPSSLQKLSMLVTPCLVGREREAL